MTLKQHANFGFTLTELLCAIAIIWILAGIYLGVIAKAFIHAKKVLDHLSGN